MSTALITICRDELDIIEPFLRHSAAQVDQIYISDHGSIDGTREILAELATDLPLVVSDLTHPGYWQSRYMTDLAQRAMAAGHNWIVASDVDEIWYVELEPERRIADYLAGIAPDVQVINANLYNHKPTALDDEAEANPFCRIGWRMRERGQAPKVCARLHPSLRIDMGNHVARYGAHGAAKFLATPGLALRHFSWRSPEQYAHKIEVGRAAYQATNMPADVGVHWRMWDGASAEEIMAHFREWYWSADPEADDELVFDPAPTLS